HKVVHHLKSVAQPNYLEGILSNEVVDNSVSNDDDAVAGGESDKLYDEAVALVIKTRRPSISLVQRHLRIGYNRAARLIEEMERAGLVSTMQSNGNREVLEPAQQGD
ncbi:MAG: DNA translocase FtsK, partial [Methylophilaceae bacterium]|nr:DNA translocase FtsK [Methylophilaceae bacterium]